MKRLWLLSILLCAAACAVENAYVIETMEIPKEINLEVGGLTFTPGGTLLVCTRWGEVWAMKDGGWRLFASGLHEPLGIWAEKDDEVYVMQRPELTRLRDTKGSGSADVFETVCDDWYLSGFETEFTFGLVRDKDRNFWGTLAPNWDSGPKSLYRGWSFKVTPEGRFAPWSLGLRNSNGLGFDPDGELFVTDNQGEWVGACTLNHVTEGAFHGCAWSIPRSKFKDTPITPEALNKIRKLPAIYFPYEILSRSASQPLWDTTGGKFGPFAGQMFVGDETAPVIMRVSLEKVGGEFQGACYPFLERGIMRGSNRLAFGPDNALYVGQTFRGWVDLGNEGIQKIIWTGKLPFEIHTMSLAPDGFDLVFTQPIDAATPPALANFTLRHFHYYYHAQYGSPEVDSTPVEVKEVKVSDDGKTIHLVLPKLAAERIYELRVSGLRSENGNELSNTRAFYTLNRLLP